MKNDWNPGNASVDLSIPRLTNEAIEDAARQLESDCVIDAIYPGRPLIISFNYFTQMDEFDFFGRFRKLEERVGAPFNHIYLRDRESGFYQHGVKGLGNTLHEVAQRLKDLIRFIRPSEVITFGQSMGACAAVLYGILLQVDRAVGFGPISHWRADWTRRDGDVRWQPLFDKLDAERPPQWYPDLVELALASPVLPRLIILSGTHPVGSSGLPNMDKLHAVRFATIPGVELYELPEAAHEVSIWLKDNDLLDDMLYRTIVAPAPTAPPAIRVLSGMDETRQFAVMSYDA
jgi:hypothetical protein